MGGLSSHPASPKLPKSPPYGGRIQRNKPSEGGVSVKLIKRLAVAMGSLVALAFAGGAHVRW